MRKGNTDFVDSALQVVLLGLNNHWLLEYDMY